MSLRTFLAIDLNALIREALRQFQDQAGSELPVKWISPGSIHLTVKFLGDIQAEQVTVLQETLRDVVKSVSPFTLCMKGLGGFPSLQKPRILWAGVSGDVERLNELVSCVESELTPLGFSPEDRPYHPHLTLSRIKANSREIGNILQTSAVCKKEWTFGELSVDRLCLFQSQLTPHGAVYSCLWRLPLGESPAGD